MSSLCNRPNVLLIIVGEKLKKLASDVEGRAFEMKRLFEMKLEDKRRKNRDCERMSETEFVKKRRKNQIGP